MLHRMRKWPTSGRSVSALDEFCVYGGRNSARSADVGHRCTEPDFGDLTGQHAVDVGGVVYDGAGDVVDVEVGATVETVRVLGESTLEVFVCGIFDVRAEQLAGRLVEV